MKAAVKWYDLETLVFLDEHPLILGQQKQAQNTLNQVFLIIPPLGSSWPKFTINSSERIPTHGF